MLAIKLNATLRTQIINNATKLAVTPQREALVELEAKAKGAAERFQQDTYEAIYTSGQREMLSSMPSDWFPETENVMVRFQSEDDAWQRDVRIQFSTERRVPFHHYSRHGLRIAKVMPKNGRLHKAWLKVIAAEDAAKVQRVRIEDTRRAVQTKINPILQSCSTVRSLLKQWPEAKELLPEGYDVPKAGLPAVVIADLNKAVGLPTAT